MAANSLIFCPSFSECGGYFCSKIGNSNLELTVLKLVKIQWGIGDTNDKY